MEFLNESCTEWDLKLYALTLLEFLNRNIHVMGLDFTFIAVDFLNGNIYQGEMGFCIRWIVMEFLNGVTSVSVA